MKEGMRLDATSLRLLSTGDAAKQLGVTTEQVRRYIRAGKLHPQDTKAGFMIPRQEVEALRRDREKATDARTVRDLVNDAATKIRKAKHDPIVGPMMAGITLDADLAQMRDLVTKLPAFQMPHVAQGQADRVLEGINELNERMREQILGATDPLRASLQRQMDAIRKPVDDLNEKIRLMNEQIIKEYGMNREAMEQLTRDPFREHQEMMDRLTRDPLREHQEQMDRLMHDPLREHREAMDRMMRDPLREHQEQMDRLTRPPWQEHFDRMDRFSRDPAQQYAEGFTARGPDVPGEDDIGADHAASPRQRPAGFVMPVRAPAASAESVEELQADVKQLVQQVAQQSEQIASLTELVRSLIQKEAGGAEAPHNNMT